MKSRSPVITLTWKGRLQVALVKAILGVVAIFKGRTWTFPLPNFQEDPRYFKLGDLAYFSYKYYYKQIKQAEENSGNESYFAAQRFEKSDQSCVATISLGGDLMPYENINNEICANLWDDVGDFFFSSDIVFANLETPVDLLKKPGLVPEVMLKGMLFNANLELFEIFNGNNKYRGFDVLSVANNHALDQDIEGLEQTMKFLKSKNIRYAGAALSKDSVDDFPVVAVHGINIAFIAFTFSLNEFDLPDEEDWRCNHIRLNKPDVDISLIIQQAAVARKRGADILVISLHMGNAYQAYPNLHIQNTIHRICQATGADVVVGGHPHNPQPFEWHNYLGADSANRRALIFYSLGDFVAYDIYSWAHLSLLVKLKISKSGSQAFVSGFEILPAYLMAERKNGKIKKLIFQHMEKISADVTKYSGRTRKDLESANELYSELLLTESQRNEIVNRESLIVNSNRGQNLGLKGTQSAH